LVRPHQPSVVSGEIALTCKAASAAVAIFEELRSRKGWRASKDIKCTS
jgi:hypothetical protein